MKRIFRKNSKNVQFSTPKGLNTEKINEELDERVEKDFDEEIHRHKHKRLLAELRRRGIMGVLFVRFSQVFIVRVLR
jgi:hypothetical protein